MVANPGVPDTFTVQTGGCHGSREGGADGQTLRNTAHLNGKRLDAFLQISHLNISFSLRFAAAVHKFLNLQLCVFMLDFLNFFLNDVRF